MTSYHELCLEIAKFDIFLDRPTIKKLKAKCTHNMYITQSKRQEENVCAKGIKKLADDCHLSLLLHLFRYSRVHAAAAVEITNVASTLGWNRSRMSCAEQAKPRTYPPTARIRTRHHRPTVTIDDDDGGGDVGLFSVPIGSVVLFLEPPELHFFRTTLESCFQVAVELIHSVAFHVDGLSSPRTRRTHFWIFARMTSTQWLVALRYRLLGIEVCATQRLSSTCFCLPYTM